jgi:DNA-binding IclR family transcriptional regulator
MTVTEVTAMQRDEDPDHHDQPETVRAAEKTAQILNVLKRHPLGLTGPGIAARCPGISNTGIYRYLNSLGKQEIVYRGEDGLYQLDPDFLEDQPAVIVNDVAVDIALKHFAHHTRHDAVIATIQDDHLMVTHHASGSNSPDPESMIEGFEDSLHASAHGYAHMAMMRPGRRRRRLRRGGLRPFTDHTILDVDAIEGRLALGNEDGIYTELANYRPDVACIAAIIHNGPGNGKYALATSMALDEFQTLYPAIEREFCRTVVKLLPHFSEATPDKQTSSE